MIKAILIFNNHGKPRLNKFYQYYVSTIPQIEFCFTRYFSVTAICYLVNVSDIFIVEFVIQINSIHIFFYIFMKTLFFQNEGQQQQIVKETFQLVSKRDDNVCNFLEGGR